MWRIADVIRYWTQVLGGYVIIDVHNFGNGPQGGKVRYDFDQAENAVPIAALSDLWVKLANRFIDNPKVWLGFMNEPNGATHNATRNRDNMQAVTNAVRARTNSLAKLFIAGCDYSSAANWVANGNAAALESYYDPARNAVFEAHCYFDADASGTKAACVSNSRSRLVSATTWARANGVKLLLGEFGAGNPAVNGQQICGVEMPGALAYMKANKDAWYGWTAYFGGDMWGAAFPFTIDPANYTTADDNGQMTMLLPYFETVPAIPA
jgi:endoglucanase